MTWPGATSAACAGGAVLELRVGMHEQGEADDDGQPQHQREHRTTPEPQAAGPGDADARRPGVRATGSRAGAGGDEGGQPAPDAHPRRAEADARPMREPARAAVEARSVPRSARAGRFRSGVAREGDRAAARRPVPRTERTRVARSVDPLRLPREDDRAPARRPVPRTERTRVARVGSIRSGITREGDRVPARRPVPRTERTRVARVGSIRSGITREGDRVAVGQAAQRDDGEATDGHRPVSAGGPACRADVRLGGRQVEVEHGGGRPVVRGERPRDEPAGAEDRGGLLVLGLRPLLLRPLLLRPLLLRPLLLRPLVHGLRREDGGRRGLAVRGGPACGGTGCAARGRPPGHGTLGRERAGRRLLVGLGRAVARDERTGPGQRHAGRATDHDRARPTPGQGGARHRDPSSPLRGHFGPHSPRTAGSVRRTRGLGPVRRRLLADRLAAAQRLRDLRGGHPLCEDDRPDGRRPATDYAAGASGRSGAGAISGRAAGANSHSRITLNRAMPPSTLAEATAIDSINAVGLSTTACSSRSTAEP